MELLSSNNLTDDIKSINRGFPQTMICFSHLRWDFVYQRPQHILTRLSKTMKIFYIEEPVPDAQGQDHYAYLSRERTL